MEKNVEISMLCQIYGKVLTEKQYEVLNDYYNNDLSLSEIAENNNITRQAVRDIIKKGENKLYELEERIGFMNKILEEEKVLANILEHLTEVLNRLNQIEETANCKNKKDLLEKSHKIKNDIQLIEKQIKQIKQIS